MGSLWPGFLLLLGLIPVIVAVYLWILRRRQRFAVRFSSLALVREALPHQSRLRRHLPFALFLLALSSLVVALSRPVAVVSAPVGQATIIMALDVSLSMCSTDIQPNRLEAAKDAAISFIQRQQPGTQIGIVAFAGFAELVQEPTADQEKLQDTVESISVGRRTAIGSAILRSIDAIAEVDKSIPPTGSDGSSGTQPKPLPEGTYAPHVIVLLTDGASNSGPLPIDAAQQAVDRGIRVYTIGFGTDDPFAPMPSCGDQFWGGFGGGGQGRRDFFGGGFRRGIDETTLKEVAAQTGAEYYSASSASELQNVFQSLPISIIIKQEKIEISVLFTALGALLACLAIGLSMIWHPLP